MEGRMYFSNSPGDDLVGQMRDSSMAEKLETLTTTGGNPVADNQNSITAGPRGPLLMQDYQLLEKLAHPLLSKIIRFLDGCVDGESFWGPHFDVLGFRLGS
jgi:hypothetical protein